MAFIFWFSPLFFILMAKSCGAIFATVSLITPYDASTAFYPQATPSIGNDSASYDGKSVWPQRPSDPSTPVGLRLGFSSPSSMNIGWSSFEQYQRPCVSYGTEEDNLNSTACSDNGSISYATSRVWYSSVELTGLQPSTKYYYKVQSSNSTIGSFTSGRTAGDNTPFNFAVAIDMGLFGTDGFKNTSNNAPSQDHPSVERLLSLADSYEFVVHPGDFGYADDWYLNPNDFFAGPDSYEAILEQFYDQLSPVSGSKPYMVGPGNHEASCNEVPFVSELCPRGQYNFTDFITRFTNIMPSGTEGPSKNKTANDLRSHARDLAVPPMWYSFDYGLVHYISINTETDFPNAPDQIGTLSIDGYLLSEGPFGYNGQQIDWLKADLASVDRSVTPWVIVGGHRPWYTASSSLVSCHECQAAFEDLFYEYGVDLAIFGHEHNSQRFKPMYKGSPDQAGYDNPKAPMYIVAGGAGNIEGQSSISSFESGTTKGFEWGDADHYAVARVDIESDSRLTVRFFRSYDGAEIDTCSLNRNHTVDFPLQ